MSVLGTPAGQSFSEWLNKTSYASGHNLNTEYIFETYNADQIREIIEMEYNNGHITSTEYEKRIAELEKINEELWKTNKELKNFNVWESYKTIGIIAFGALMLGILFE